MAFFKKNFELNLNKSANMSYTYNLVLSWMGMWFDMITFVFGGVAAFIVVLARGDNPSEAS